MDVTVSDFGGSQCWLFRQGLDRSLREQILAPANGAGRTERQGVAAIPRLRSPKSTILFCGHQLRFTFETTQSSIFSSSFCNMSNSPVVGKVTEGDWDRFKETIQTLYLVENRKLEGPDGVRDEMLKYNFNQAYAAL